MHPPVTFEEIVIVMINMDQGKNFARYILVCLQKKPFDYWTILISLYLDTF